MEKNYIIILYVVRNLEWIKKFVDDIKKIN